MKRLKAIVNFINENDVVADVGCDHGYLLRLAIEEKNIKKGYAIDNKKGPLNSAKNNLEKYENIDFVLSDGLTNVKSDDINCVVIAGMGGMLINTIVSDSLEKFKNINKVIVCPNKNIDKVREYFNSIGYKINFEDIVCEDNKYYEIIVFEKGNEELTKKEKFFGPCLLRGKNETFLKKWNEYYNHIINIDNKKEEIQLIKEVIYES